jgi:SAM-dependent methyltransferase
VRRYLEVGCGFGFGVDFAAHTLGWAAMGLEPSQLGVAGREALGIDVRSEYLDERTSFSEPNDLVFSSEVLEHVPAPWAFLKAAVRALAPRGVLLLTTPNAARLKPDASQLTQLSILSYPFHAILYTRATLERVLTEVGFPFVHVIERGDTLIAMASARPFAPLDGRLDRAHFRAYLSQRLAELRPGTPVATGFAYRSFKECVNCADYAGAEAALERLREEVTLRFGTQLGHLVPVAASQAQSLADLARARPLNLCGCYYFQGMLALNHWIDPELAARFFDAARSTGTELRRLLWTIGVDDGETEDLVLQATIHSKLAWERVRPAAPESIPEPASESVAEHLPDSVSEPASQPVLEPAFEPVPEPVGEPVPEPASESVSVRPPESVSEVALEPARAPLGYLDAVSEAGVASGWAFDPAAPFRELTVELCIDGEPAKETAADLFRADLAAKGSFGNGCHAFSESIASLLVEDRAYVISARVAGVDLKPGPIVVRGRAPTKGGKGTAKAVVDSKRFLHVEHDPPAVARLARSSRRLAIVVFFQAQGRVFNYHRRLLRDLASQGFTTVLVRNGAENLARFVDAAKGLADLVLVRENAGLDFSAWISAFQLLGIELSELSELIFVNDSVIGPLFPLREAITQMAAADCDFWGMTDSWGHAYHLQSYFLCFKETALRSAALSDYLRHYAHPTDKDEVIEQGEVGLTQALLTADLRPQAYCPYSEVAKRWLLDLPRRMAEATQAPEALASAAPDDPMCSLLTRRSAYYSNIASNLRSGEALNSSHFFWDTLIADFRLPFVKKDLLLRNPAGVPNVGDIHALLETQTDFPLSDLLEVFSLSPGALAPPLPLVLEPASRAPVELATEQLDALS